MLNWRKTLTSTFEMPLWLRYSSSRCMQCSKPAMLVSRLLWSDNFLSDVSLQASWLLSQRHPMLSQNITHAAAV